MLSDSINSNLYPEWLSHVKSETAKDAFRYLVGAAALLKKYTCHVQSKGVVKDFRFIDQNNEQPFAFIVNMKWLLFYFRAPSIRSGSFALDELQDSFPLASKNNRGEWTIRIHNIQEACVLMKYLELE